MSNREELVLDMKKKSFSMELVLEKAREFVKLNSSERIDAMAGYKRSVNIQFGEMVRHEAIKMERKKP